MEVTHVLDKYNVCRILEDIYNTAKMYNGSRIILLNTYNRQSTNLNPNRYSINVLKETNNGNEEVWTDTSSPVTYW